MDEKQMIKDLEALHINVTVQHFSGDNSYPTEYTIQYKNISVMEPRFDMALLEFIKRLLPKMP